MKNIFKYRLLPGKSFLGLTCLLLVLVLIGGISLIRTKRCSPDPNTPLEHPVFALLPDLKKQANAETESKWIPWHSGEANFTVKLIGTLATESPMVQVNRGEWSYTLTRLSYRVTQVLSGDFPEKELTFFVERTFPTQKSGIMYKELWPFTKNRPLIFKLRKEAQRFLIVSIENDPNEPKIPADDNDASNPKS
jgi:hypothetical protein